MARNAFIDAQGVLKAHGFVTFNGGDQTPLAVPDDFALEPNRWRWDGAAFVPFVPPPTQAELDRAAARVALDAIPAGGLPEVKRALDALRKVLGL